MGKVKGVFGGSTVEVSVVRRIVIGFLLVALIGGCATPHRKPDSQTQQLKDHIALLETELDRKDQEISRLEQELAREQEIRRPVKERKGEEKRGSSITPSIKQIQIALKAAGFYKGRVDGKMGPRTKKAIESFQRANGLKADGIVGKKTWTKLARYLD